jgi:hypothetical protein
MTVHASVRLEKILAPASVVRSFPARITETSGAFDSPASACLGRGLEGEALGGNETMSDAIDLKLFNLKQGNHE